MAEYSFEDLANLWTNAGGPAALAPVMAAIGLAESSGNPSPSTGNGGGLWQIAPANASLLARNGIDYSNINDPSTNAEAAVAVWKEQGLCAWQSFSGEGCNTGFAYDNHYAQFLPGGSAQAASASNAVQASAPAVQGAGFTPKNLSSGTVTALAVVAFVVIIAVVMGQKTNPQQQLGAQQT